MPNCSLDSSTTSLLSMMITFGFGRDVERYRKHSPSDFGGRHGHVFRLRMVEKGVLEDHQQRELDGHDHHHVARQGRAVKPCRDAFPDAAPATSGSHPDPGACLY